MIGRWKGGLGSWGGASHRGWCRTERSLSGKGLCAAATQFCKQHRCTQPTRKALPGLLPRGPLPSPALPPAGCPPTATPTTCAVSSSEEAWPGPCRPPGSTNNSPLSLRPVPGGGPLGGISRRAALCPLRRGCGRWSVLGAWGHAAKPGGRGLKESGLASAPSSALPKGLLWAAGCRRGGRGL